MNEPLFDGIVTRLEFDEMQLHSTFHNRNDGSFVAACDTSESDDHEQTIEMGLYIAKAVNHHAMLVEQLRIALDVIDGSGSINMDAARLLVRMAE